MVIAGDVEQLSLTSCLPFPQGNARPERVASYERPQLQNRFFSRGGARQAASLVPLPGPVPLPARRTAEDRAPGAG